MSGSLISQQQVRHTATLTAVRSRPRHSAWPSMLMLAAVVMLAAASWALVRATATADEARAMHSLEMEMPHPSEVAGDDVEFIPVSLQGDCESCLLYGNCDAPSTNADGSQTCRAGGGGTAAAAADSLVIADDDLTAATGSEGKAAPPVVNVIASQYTQYVIVQRSVPWSVQNFKALNPYCTGPNVLKNPDGGINACAYVLWSAYPFSTLSNFNVKVQDIKVMYTTNFTSIPPYFTKIWLMCNLPIIS